MLKIRRPLGRLIFNMGIAIPGKTVFLIETAPCLWITGHCCDIHSLGMIKAAFTQGAVLLQCSATLRCLAALLQLDLLHRTLFHTCVSGSGMSANSLKGAFTQGTASPAGGLVPKRVQRRQRRRKLAHGPNLPSAAKLPPASVKMLAEINWIQLTAPRGSAAPRRGAAKQRPV